MLTGGPWVVDDATLALEPWTPKFFPSNDRLSRTVLWMRLLNLPPICWNESILKLIVANAGGFIRSDDLTSLLSKRRYARVVVEVDMATPLVPGTDIQLDGLDLPIFWQSFEYEHIHLYCGSCVCVGHRSLHCKSPPHWSVWPLNHPPLLIPMSTRLCLIYCLLVPPLIPPKLRPMMIRHLQRHGCMFAYDEAELLGSRRMPTALLPLTFVPLHVPHHVTFHKLPLLTAINLMLSCHVILVSLYLHIALPLWDEEGQLRHVTG